MNIKNSLQKKEQKLKSKYEYLHNLRLLIWNGITYFIRAVQAGLVSLFNGISTFGGYLMPKPFS